MKLYGIVNCSTVKTARAWLDRHRHAYDFVDFRKSPPARDDLERWCAALGWERVLNRRGTTWRLLSPEEQARVRDAATAIDAMLARPTLIKRPIVETEGAPLVGFDEQEYARRLLRR